MASELRELLETTLRGGVGRILAVGGFTEEELVPVVAGDSRVLALRGMNAGGCPGKFPETGARCFTLEFSLETLPFRDGILDLVLCLDMLRTAPRPELVLQEFSRVLKPGGRLLLLDLQPVSSYKFQLYRAAAHLQKKPVADLQPGFSRADLLNLLVRRELGEVFYRRLSQPAALGFYSVPRFALLARRYGGLG